MRTWWPTLLSFSGVDISFTNRDGASVAPGAGNTGPDAACPESGDVGEDSGSGSGSGTPGSGDRGGCVDGGDVITDVAVAGI